MIPNHLWQSTVFAGAVALLVFALRKNYARIRYWLWLAASQKFLLPFSLLITAGKHIEWSAVTPKAQNVSVVMEQISQPFAREQGIAAIAQPVLRHGSFLPAILFVIWICGFAAVAILWWRRWQRIHTAIRRGAPLPLRIDVPALSTPALLEPGVFGIFRPMLLLPEGITDRLTAAHLEAIIAHEMCHVRRRDNLTAALHMAVEAVFWFHPLVWWLGARLVEERERACDEEVLRLGNEPQVYAGSILKTCEFYLESPLACVSGISGSDLKQRIVRIMTEGLEKKLSFWQKFLLATVGVVALAAPIVLGLMNAPQSRAQSQENIAAPSFEVASIKVNNGGGGWPQSLYSRNGRFVATNISLKSLLQMAYGLKDSQIAGAPSWTNTEKYDIEAKPDDAVVEALQKLTSPEKFNGELNLMIQSLIRNRFKLASHYETKELPVYVLLVARNGPKFHEAATTPTGSTPPNPRGPSSLPPKGSYIRMGGRGQLDAVDANLDMFIDVLSQQIGRIILNQTGLKAKYDFTLKWTPDEGHPEMFKGAGAPPSEAAPPPDTSGPTIFTAVQEQLGLKLEAQKSSMPVLIVDHIERPTEN